MSRIGELLVREKMLSLQQLQQAQEEAKRTGKRLGATLSRLGYVKDQDLTQFVANLPVGTYYVQAYASAMVKNNYRVSIKVTP